MARPLHLVTAESRALDPADRLRLAAELIDSVEGAEATAWTVAWAAELDSRVADAARDGDHGRPWTEVHASILHDLAGR